MTNKEIVIKVLENCGCQNSHSISCYAKRTFGLDISPAKVTGALRSLYNAGKVGKSSNGAGSIVYWLVGK